jgi:tRNA pseudouridine32 synthase/23S rRNA pseudouridine746 synthase
VRPVERFDRATLVEASPLTGRTHQIRVHLAAAGHPLVVDPQYGVREVATFADLGRTPLHAVSLALPEDVPGPRSIEAPLPADFARALEVLRARL